MPYAINWNFGDGSTGTGASILHTFLNAQSFTVTETSTDSSSPSQTATSSKTVTISRPPPLSTSFTLFPSSPIINAPVTFTATTTRGTFPYTMNWNFGDGATGTGAITTHTYTTAQSFTVTETATDSSSPSQTATSSKTVTISRSPPLSTSFTFLPSGPVINLPVTFTATTTGGTVPYAISWSFGDGATGIGAITTHTYTTAQSFTVTETATDSSSPSQIAASSQTLTVYSTVPPLSTGFTVLPSNPTVNLPAAFTATMVGGTTPYTVNWDFGDGATATGATASHTFTGAQSFTITETVTDSSSLTQTATSSRTVTVTVQTATNYPPSLAVPTNQTTTVGLWVNFTITASDPTPGKVIALSASEMPPGAAFDPRIGRFSWRPSTSQTGYYTIVFTVTDNSAPSMSSTKPVGIQVYNANGGTGAGSGGSGGSSSGCLWCAVTPKVSNGTILFVAGGLLGLIASLALLTVKAQTTLERTKRRINRVNY